MNKDQLLQKIETAKSPDFGDILSKSFDLYKKVWLDGFLHLIVTVLVAIPLVLAIYIPFLSTFMEEMEKEGSLENYQPNIDLPFLTGVGYVIMFFVIMILTQAFSIGITAHFFKVCKIKDFDSPEDAGSYFSYFKGVNIGKLFILSMVTFGIAFVATVLCFLPLIYVMVPLQLIIVFFAFNDDLSVSEIISLSFKLGNKFWLLVFGLIIVSSMIAQLGMILCFVGLFFTAYFAYIPIYYFYKKTIGFTGYSEDSVNEFSTEYLN